VEEQILICMFNDNIILFNYQQYSKLHFYYYCSSTYYFCDYYYYYEDDKNDDEDEKETNDNDEEEDTYLGVYGFTVKSN